MCQLPPPPHPTTTTSTSLCALTVLSQNANEVYRHQRIQSSFMATRFNFHLPRAVTQAVQTRWEASKGANRMATGAAPARIKGSRMGSACSNYIMMLERHREREREQAHSSARKCFPLTKVSLCFFCSCSLPHCIISNNKRPRPSSI